LYLTKEQKEVLRIINSISKIHVPIVEEISGELVILNPKMTAKEQILILLLQRHPNPIQRKDIRRWVKGKSTRQINRALSDLESESLVFETQDGVTLTSKGIVEVEKVQIKYYEAQ
jgi:predicted transcriptional regulator